MVALLEPRRALLALVMSVAACATYGPELIESAGSGQSGSGGAASNSGDGAGAMAATGAMAGSGGSGATAGDVSSGTGGLGEGGKADMPETAPYVTVIIGAPSITVGLSLDGSLDWAHWGLAKATDYNHKTGVASQLLDFKPTGSKAATRYLDGPITFTWSDGTPTQSASTQDGIMWTGVGEGFQLVVPAVVEVRTLRLYLGVSNGTGQIKANLSDPRANSQVDDRFTSPSAAWKLQVVSLEFGSADKPDTTLNVSWKVETAMDITAAVSLTGLSIGKN